jgi:hypothetical protein
LIKTTCQHLLLLIGFDTLIYRKYYDTPLYLWVITPAHGSHGFNAWQPFRCPTLFPHLAEFKSPKRTPKS